jgi:hypothetical protein
LYTKNGTTPLPGDTVVWLWASKEKGGRDFNISELIDTTSIVCNRSANYVEFRAGTNLGKFTKGNVILALKEKASGRIVWSWHIWMTDQPKDLGHGGGKVFLDRNIGALSALSAQASSSTIDNFGFVYQWGRKDPFYGADGRRNETATTDAAANVLSIARANTIVNASSRVAWPEPFQNAVIADTAKANPMRFIGNSTSTDPDVPVDWLSGSATPVRWHETNKTDNDPCPDGYKVPNRNDMDSLHKADNSINFKFEYRSHGYWEYIDRRSSPTIYNSFWPTAGMRQGRNLGVNRVAQLLYAKTDGAGGQCFYWTSTPFRLRPAGSHRLYTSGLLLYSRDEYGDNADAYPIRCVKMP